MTIEVKPGFSDKDVLTFPNKGNEAYGHPPSKLLIKFKEVPHESFQRKGQELIYTHKISLEDALLAQPVHIVSYYFS